MGDPQDADDSVDRIPDAGDAQSADAEPRRSEIEQLQSDLEELQESLAAADETIQELRAEVEDRTVHREEIESDLQGYVRKRIRRGHARGWGPYLVLLYGTVMTIGAFAHLSGGWAILAMIVIWLSTLGLYVLMVLAGLAVSALSAPRRASDAAGTAIEKLGELRS